MGATLVLGLSHILPCPFPLKRNSQKAFVLAVRLRIKPGTLALFKEKWGVLAKHCRSSAEPNCLSYELCVEKDDECSLLIYERYVSEEDLSGTHNSSVPFKTFGKWLNEVSDIVVPGSKSKNFYIEVCPVASFLRTVHLFPFPHFSLLPTPSPDKRWAHGKIINTSKIECKLIYGTARHGAGRTAPLCVTVWTAAVRYSQLYWR